MAIQAQSNRTSRRSSLVRRGKMTTAPGSVDVDYSAAATLIHFGRPLPLLRGPIRAGPADDPSLGPHLLAFRNPQSFFSAHSFCRSKLLSQCEAGVRIGCSLAASSKCQTPWWKLLLGGGGDFKERERCEEREMTNCLEESKGKCEKFAEEKSSAVFRTARVARRGRWKVGQKEAADFVGWISLLGPEKRDLELGLFGAPENLVYEVNTRRGSELIDAQSIQD